MYSDINDEYCSVEDCALRMNITPQRVRELIERRALTAHGDAGYTVVAPAILSGAVR